MPGVRSVELTGSGAAGDRTPLSDWDFDVEVDGERVLRELERALQRLPAIAVFWDPLSPRANLIVLLDGPIKVDVVVADMRNPHPVARWTVTAESLPRIDAHFWDWTLWLSAKQLRGRADLVDAELTKMWGALLEPMGVVTTPRDITEAVGAYLTAREKREHELGTRVDRRLENQVRGALVTHNLMTDG